MLDELDIGMLQQEVEHVVDLRLDLEPEARVVVPAQDLQELGVPVRRPNHLRFREPGRERDDVALPLGDDLLGEQGQRVGIQGAGSVERLRGPAAGV